VLKTPFSTFLGGDQGDNFFHFFSNTMYDNFMIFIFDSENKNNVVRCFDRSPEDSKNHMTLLFGKIKTFFGVPYIWICVLNKAFYKLKPIEFVRKHLWFKE